MYCLARYPKSFPFRRSASRRSPISSFHFRVSPVSPFFSAFPYKNRLTPLSTAFTHSHGVGGVQLFPTFGPFRLSDLATFRRTFRPSDVQTISFHHLTNPLCATSLFSQPSALPGGGVLLSTFTGHQPAAGVMRESREDSTRRRERPLQKAGATGGKKERGHDCVVPLQEEDETEDPPSKNRGWGTQKR